MSTVYERWSQKRLFAYIAGADIEKPAGFAIEIYFERFPITDDVVRVLERFLASTIVGNRAAALEALIVYGNRSGYEADVVLMHLHGRENRATAAEFESLTFLERLETNGSAVASRVLAVLNRDPYVRQMWRGGD